MQVESSPPPSASTHPGLAALPNALVAHAERAPSTSASDAGLALAHTPVDPVELGKLFWPFALAPTWAAIALFLVAARGRPLLALVAFPLSAAIAAGGWLWFIAQAQSLFWKRTTLAARAVRWSATPPEVFPRYGLSAWFGALSLGMSFPWFLRSWLEDTHVTLEGADPGTRFDGEPSEVALPFSFGLFLTLVTFGAFGPWWLARTMRWRWEGTRTEHTRGQFVCDPSEQLGPWMRGWWLSVLTFGVYTPWFLAMIWQWETRCVR